MGTLLTDLLNKRLNACNLFFAALVVIFFLGIDIIKNVSNEKIPMRQLTHPVQIPTADLQSNEIDNCKNQCKPLGSELLPKGIVSQTSNLEMQPLWGSPERTHNANPSKSLLAIPVGIKQKEVVDKIVSKFPLTEFTIMLFHYDGAVDEWRDLEWANSALHISAINQTKWWFAKRFLHPDIVAEYDYIFLWDEDLGVENFHPAKYLSIVKREGLEISQPALDTEKSQIHHGITARWKKGAVHRRFYKSNGGGICNENSTAPPCTGWVEMMAPVFSKSSWRCVWHMIQNDLIYGWGMDYKFGYCAQGDRSLNVGVVDSEYIVHKGIPSLGGLNESKAQHGSPVSKDGDRFAVRQRSFAEWKMFDKRWQNAAADDKCWTDRYPAPEKPSWHGRFNFFHLISFSASVSQSQTNSQTKAPEHST